MTGERTALLEAAIVIDDGQADAVILERFLRKGVAPDVTVKHYSDCDSGLAGLAENPSAVLFLDLDIGLEDGADLLKKLRAKGDERIIIVVSGGERRAQEVLAAGANSFLSKHALTPALLEATLSELLA